MRNHIIFKFIAVFLCTVSLLGTLGSAAGLFIMTELDLYSKTVDQLKAERVQENSALQAELFALRYASTTLGSCPEDIVDRHYGYYYNAPESGTCSYTLLDADGNVLSTLGDVTEVAETFRYPVSGQYLHLVSMETASQAMEAEARKHLESYSNALTDIDGNRVPEEGLFLDHVFFTDRDGHVIYEALTDGLTGSSTYYYRDYLLENGAVDSFTNSYDHMGGHTGFLFYNVSAATAITKKHGSGKTAHLWLWI